MKNLSLSIIAVMAMASVSMAETFPADGPKSYKALHDTEYSSLDYTGRPYVGIGYSYMNTNVSIAPVDVDLQGNAVMLVGGYEINQYFAIEGRYSKTMNDLDVDITAPGIDEGGKLGGDISNFGLYLKPMYASGPFGLYGLLGVGHVKVSFDQVGSNSENEFQWGLGISFTAGQSFIGNSDVTFFADYTSLYHDSYNSYYYNIGTDIDAFSFGLNFKF